MGLQVRTSTFSPAENQEWLGSAHGTQECDPITLDATTCVAVFPTGLIPSGVTLGKISASGKYGPYSNAAVDGRTDMVGHLFTTIDLTAGGTQTAADTPAALLWHGEVVEAKLPANHGLDANGKTDVKGLIRYV